MRSLRLLFLCGIAVAPLAARAGNRVLDTPARFRSEPASSAIAADFTRDGNLDVLCLRAGYAQVLTGAGNGTFARGIANGTSFEGQATGIADFNRDGNPDLYIKAPDVAFAVMLGTGAGTFQNTMTRGSSTPDLLAAGDFNGDTFADVVTFTAAGGVIQLHPGNGFGGFGSGSTSSIAFTGTATDIATGDFDNDGRLDLLLVGEQQAAMAWNNGGTFTALALPQLAGKAAATGDINGDGRADAVVITWENMNLGGMANIAFGASARNVTLTQFKIEGNTYGDVAVAQMDGIGGADIIIAMRDVTVHSFDGVKFRTPRSHAIGGSDSGMLMAADFDSDSKTDVVTLAPDVFYMTFIHGNGDGTLAADPAFPLRPMFEGGLRQALDASDMNGDGRRDVTLVNYAGTHLAIALADSIGLTAPVLTALPAAQVQWNAYRAGDLNSDGRVDVLLTSKDASATAQFATWFAQANGTFIAGPVTTGAATSRCALAADLNGDGRVDIIDTGGRLYTGVSNGTFSGPIATNILATTSMFAVDVNHDGAVDVAAWAYGFAASSAPMFTYLNNGSGTFGPAIDSATKFLGIDGILDLNGDNLPDVLSFGAIHRGLGNGTFAASELSIPRRDLFNPGPRSADFDGDGKLDLAVNGAIYYGAGDGTFESAAQTAARGDIFSLADFDGNGSPDLWLADLATSRIAVIRTRRQPTGTAAITLPVSAYGEPSKRLVNVSSYMGFETSAEIRGTVLVRVNSQTQALVFVDDNHYWRANVLMSVGTSAVEAIFSGDRFHAAVSGSTTHTVEKHYVNVNTGSGSITWPEYGQPLVLCGIVTPYPESPAVPPPTGNITYRIGGTTLGTSPATPNTQCQDALSVTNTAVLTIGEHTLVMDYPGDGSYLPAHSETTVRVAKIHSQLSLSPLPQTLFEGQQVTVTATLADAANRTGTMTFTTKALTHTFPLTNGQAVLTTQFGWGTDTLRVTYSGDATYAATTTSAPLLVYRGGMTSAPAIRATATPAYYSSAYAVLLELSPIQWSDYFEIYRSVNGGPVSRLADWPATSYGFPTDSLAAGSVAVYHVLARNNGGGMSPKSAREIASAVTFTDEPLLAGTTKVRALHVTQLQNAINAVRIAAGLSSTTFPIDTFVTAAQLNALRTALTQARAALGLSSAFSDPTITPGVTPVRAIHWQELRDAVK